MARQPKTLPATTEAHRRAAFLAMEWLGWTYEQAMTDPVRSRLVAARASQMRKAQTKAQQRFVLPVRYARATATDQKRAAAGDCDE
jgi:hypothetical protein